METTNFMDCEESVWWINKGGSNGGGEGLWRCFTREMKQVSFLHKEHSIFSFVFFNLLTMGQAGMSMQQQQLHIIACFLNVQVRGKIQRSCCNGLRSDVA